MLRVFGLRITLFALLFMTLQTRLCAEVTHQGMEDSLRMVISTTTGNARAKAFRELYECIQNNGIEEELEVIRMARLTAENDRMDPIWIGYWYLLEALAYYNYNDEERFESYLPVAYDFYNKHNKHDYITRLMLMEAEKYYYSNRYEHALRVAGRLRDRSIDNNQPLGEISASEVIGKIYLSMGILEKAREYFEYVIKSVRRYKKRFPDINKLAVLDSYDCCIGFLISQRDYSAAMQLCGECDEFKREVEEEYERLNAYYNMDLYDMRLIIHRINIFVFSGRLEESRMLIEHFESRYNSVVMDTELNIFRLSKAAYLRSKGDMDGAVTLIDSVMSHYEGVGDVSSLINAAERKLEVLSDKMQYERAFSLQEFVRHKNDSLRNSRFVSQLNELHTLHNLDQMSIKNAHFKRYILLLAVAVFLLLLLIVIYFFFSMDRKSKKKMLFNIIERQTTVENAAKSMAIHVAESSLSKEQLLYARLLRLMEDDTIFLNPNLTRKDVADLLNTNERYLANSIKAVKDLTFKDYINSSRLNYAISLLKSDKQESLEVVAEKSGFTTYLSFYRNFKKEYGITPTDYRNLNENSGPDCQ